MTDKKDSDAAKAAKAATASRRHKPGGLPLRELYWVVVQNPMDKAQWWVAFAAEESHLGMIILNATRMARGDRPYDVIGYDSNEHRPDQETRVRLRDAGYNWAPISKVWYGPKDKLLPELEKGRLTT